MQELSGHPLFCYDNRNEVFGLAGISFDSKMTQIQNLYHRMTADSFLRRFTPKHYKDNLMWNSKVMTAMFLDVQSEKDWILTVVEENPVKNSKPFWIRKKKVRFVNKPPEFIRENSGNSTNMSSTIWTFILLCHQSWA